MGMSRNKQDYSIGFVGGGRITSILLEAWEKEGDLPGTIFVNDSNTDVLKALKAKHPAIESSTETSKITGCDVVFLALHPPAIAVVLSEIKGKLKPSAVLISLAPKWSIEKLMTGLSGFNRIVRIIPNASSIVNEGYNPVTFSSAIKDNEKKDILRLFKAFGGCPEVEEDKLEAYAILCAMGPTYLWFQMQKLRELGVSFGLTAKEADKALYEMVKGAAKTLFKSGLAYDDVVNLIPVKPLADDEPVILQAYEAKLKGLYEKLKE
jgi:pyrroline-5-carboxylate reductase